MADTLRTRAYLLATSFADNTAGDISAQDMRDGVVSMFGNYAVIGVGGNTTPDAMTVSGTYQKVTTFDTNVISAGDALTADQANSKIDLDADGIYFAHWTCSFTGTNNTTFLGALYLNSAEVTNQGHWEREIGSSSSVGSACASAILSGSAATSIECYLKYSAGTGTSFTPQEMALAVVKIG